MSAWRRPTTGAPCRCSTARTLSACHSTSPACGGGRREAPGGELARTTARDCPLPTPPPQAGEGDAPPEWRRCTTTTAEKKILTVIDRRPKDHKNQRQEATAWCRAWCGRWRHEQLHRPSPDLVARHRDRWSRSLLFLIFAVWPPELEQVLGRKRIFLSALLNGITLGGLYFLVASGFTLIFGLMRNVNLAHGSLYLFGGYIGYEIAQLDRKLDLRPDRDLHRRRAARHRAAVHHLPLDGGPGPAPDAGHHRALDHPRRPDAVALGRRLLPGADAGLARRPGRGAAGHRGALERRARLPVLSAGAPRDPRSARS